MVNSHGRFVWYELMTTDVAGAIPFYAKVMGWNAWDASMPGRPFILFSAGPISVSALTELPPDARTAGAKPNWLGYVGADDVDATAARIVRLGGKVIAPPTDVADISRFAVFADPQATRFGLFTWRRPGAEPPADLAGPGRVGWHDLLAADGETAFPFYRELFGWQLEGVAAAASGTYRRFFVGDEPLGGMRTKPEATPAPMWLYYFNVGDIEAAAQRVTAGGGRVFEGPLQVLDGNWIVQCTDPQGGIFALRGKRRGGPVGYFEPVASRDRR